MARPELRLVTQAEPQPMPAQDLLPGIKVEDIPAVFDVRGLARILGVSRSTAYTITHLPRFPIMVYSRKCSRIYREKFLEWMEWFSAQGRDRWD